MHLRESVLIAAEPGAVARHYFDFAADPGWRHAVDEMSPDTPGPAHPGQRVREVLTFRGTTYVTEMRLLDVTARRVVFDGGGDDTRVHGVRSVADDHRGTVVTLELTIRLRGLRRLVEPVLGVMYRRLVREDLARLRAQLEGSLVAT
jgi:Polyketide cyclase / dehydrase and lipid transport